MGVVVDVAGVTVNCVEPLIPSKEALIVEVPGGTPLTRPCNPDAFETVATAGFEELQIASALTSSVVLSAYMPMAMNCWVVPRANTIIVRHQHDHREGRNRKDGDRPDHPGRRPVPIVGPLSLREIREGSNMCKCVLE